ncbi:LPS export ABC transporter periplasmic protein LptC [Fulvivirgaceae bacterium BMA10]|uniref:LPS export ABC transporter periplasmic protein LptC n=1 Tax=Splendidivirga corallicola TaxID=3051826 RepID=A0ABT8KUM7_9BACT|nr:LPS export ABC transporter periplasmic protein LptC [Fulvivirgaceae bacterium BMA10]
MKSFSFLLPFTTSISYILIALYFVSCSSKEQAMPGKNQYEGPLTEAYDVETLYSDSAVVMVKIVGAKQNQFFNGDIEYPEGIFIEFYDKISKKVTSTLKANKGFYNKKEDLFRVEEDVEVINFEKNQRLNSEELFWDPKKEEVYTEKFVNIDTGDDIVKGTGLVAKQDFSSWEILKPTGDISIDDGQL